MTAKVSRSDSKLRRSNTRRVVFAVVIGCVLGVALFGYVAYRDLLVRSFAFRAYVEAVLHYAEQHGEMPESLNDAAREYIDYEGRRVEALPVSKAIPLPMYRPVKDLRQGTFLILAETEPRKWYALRRCVYYIHVINGVPILDHPDTGFRHDWRWDVEALIRADDLWRANARVGVPQQ